MAKEMHIMEHETLASEILTELKHSCRRWFIAFCVMVFLEVATIAGFMWYISLPVEYENVQIENSEGYANYVGKNLLGGLFNGNDQGTEGTQVEKK